MKYQVFEHNQPCGEIAKRIQLDDSWHQDTFDTREMAEYYASAWACGNIQAPRHILDLVWKRLAIRPLSLELNVPNYINDVVVTIKEIDNA